eukprot:scaffold1569_cov171-Amphora_coffeaeformis.AAC.19
MDRGVTDACRAHLEGTKEMEIRRCEARTEFKYFVGGNEVAQSLEDASCLCRLCCQPCHP